MKEENKKNLEKMHHANIVIGGEEAEDYIFDAIENNLNIKVKANPDFLMLDRVSFGIDDSRILEKWIGGKPLIGDIKTALIKASTITSEAQNALLKSLEEPPLGTYLFFRLDSEANLIPTLLSRVRLINISKKNEIAVNAKKFLSLSNAERMRLIKSISLKSDDKEESRKLINNLEEVMFNKINTAESFDDKKAIDLKNILKAKIYSSARGSSPKMLLEWLSCVIE